MKRLMESSRKLSCAMYKSVFLVSYVHSQYECTFSMQECFWTIDSKWLQRCYIRTSMYFVCLSKLVYMYVKPISLVYSIACVYVHVYLSSVSAIIHLRTKDWRTCRVVCSAAQSWRFWGTFLNMHVVVHRMNNRMTHKMFCFVYCVITSHVSYWHYLCDTHSSGTTFEPWYWTTSFASYVYTHFVYITYYCINHSLRLRGTRLTKESGTTLSTILKELSLLKWLL